MLLSNQKHGRQVEQPEHRVLRAEDPSGGGRISNSPCFVGRSTGLGSYATWTKKGAGWMRRFALLHRPFRSSKWVGSLAKKSWRSNWYGMISIVFCFKGRVSYISPGFHGFQNPQEEFFLCLTGS